MPTIQEIIDQFMRGEEPPPDPATVDSQGRPIQPGAQRFDLRSGGADPATSDLMSILERVIQEEAVSDPFMRERQQSLGPLQFEDDLLNARLAFENPARAWSAGVPPGPLTPQPNQMESNSREIRLPTSQRPGPGGGTMIGQSIRPPAQPAARPPVTALRNAPSTGSQIGASIQPQPIKAVGSPSGPGPAPYPFPGGRPSTIPPPNHPDISALVSSIHRPEGYRIPEGYPFPATGPLTGPAVSANTVPEHPRGGPDVYPPSETGETFPTRQAFRSTPPRSQIGTGFQPTATDRLNNAQRDRILAQGQGPSTVPFDAALEGVPANSLPGPASNPSPSPLRAAAPAPPMPANIPPQAVQSQTPPAIMGNETPEAFKAAILDQLRKATLAAHQPR